MPRKDTSKTKEITVTDVIAKAKIDENRSDLYSNYAQVLITNNEIMLDLYYLSPQVGPIQTLQLTAIRVQRVIIPLSTAKGLAGALANTIAQYEEDHDITLPNQRPPQENDKIIIWP